MDSEVREEAMELVRSARAFVAERLEEGVESYPRPVQEEASAAPAPSGAPGAQRGEVAPDAGVSEPAAARPPRAAADPAPTARAPAPASPAAPADEARPAAGATLEQLRATLGECTRCPLCEGRTRIVFGAGNPDADLMFVGEAPGEQEDRQGLPFVGRAGDLLTQMIEKGLGIERSSVYICNIVKCRPPANRTPLPAEIAACKPFLDGQIDAVAPRVIVALGRPAASVLLGRDVSITRLRGTWHAYRGIPVMPTLHPAYVLRQYTAQVRRAVWEDLKAAHARVQQG